MGIYLQLFNYLEILACTYAQRSKVAFNLKNRKILLGTDDNGANQVSAIPHPMITFLTD
jgi:hypothetical protein